MRDTDNGFIFPTDGDIRDIEGWGGLTARGIAPIINGDGGSAL